MSRLWLKLETLSFLESSVTQIVDLAQNISPFTKVIHISLGKKYTP